jgi:hypothetical protein
VCCEITIQQLNDNPGLYPLVKGKALIKESSWSLIKILDYSPLLHNYNTLKNNLLNTIALLKNKHYLVPQRHFSHIKETTINYDNQLLLIQQYLDKTDQLIDQLFPEIHTTHKFKRAIFDGLGTLIKFITGNLNAEDGKRYDELINKLITSSDTQKTVLQEQTQILNDSINIFSSNIKNLAKNQELLNENLNKVILNTEFEIDEILGTISTYTILDQSIQSLQLFISTCSDLEISLTFAQSQQIHLSLIDNNELLSALENISRNLQELQTTSKRTFELPYPINYGNLHLYESLIQIKIYQKNTSFTFIYEIPLIKPSLEYQYIQLIPFPAFNEKYFQIIIPTYNNILFSTEFSIPIASDHCKEITNSHFFCLENNHFLIPNSKLCETQLLTFKDNQTCQPFIFYLHSTKIIKINHSTWILSSPNTTIIDIKCTNSLHRKIATGSILIHLTNDCSAMINQNELLTTFESTSVEEKQIQIASIGKLQITPSIKSEINKIDLTSIDLHHLVLDQQKLTKQKSTLENIDPINYKHISYSSLIIVLIILILLTCFIVYIYRKRILITHKLSKSIHENQSVNDNSGDFKSIPLVQCTT